MASSGRGRTPRSQPTSEDLAAELAKLRMENRVLKKKLKNESPQTEMVLTSVAKETMIVSLTGNLTRVAAKKIEARVRKEAAKVVTKAGFEDMAAALSMRIDVSMKDLGERADGRGRSKSRSRQSE